MKRIFSLFKRSLCMMLLAAMMFVLSACSAEEAKLNSEYYDELNSYTDTLLMQNRELTKIKEKWDYKDKKSTEAYIGKLSEIEESLSKIRNLTPTEKLAETDESLKKMCDEALASVALTKSTVQNAYDTKDKAIYDKNDTVNSESYSSAYNEIIDSAASVRAQIR